MSTEDMPSLVRNNINFSLKSVNKNLPRLLVFFTEEFDVDNQSHLEENHDDFTEQNEALDLDDSPPPINEIEANEEI